MKGLMTKITALLLVVWYSMSIIGFDVHTCSGSGRSFVATFIEGLDCEDVHPEHHCCGGSCCEKAHSCCHQHKGVTLKSKSCCTNDYQALTLTGTMPGDEGGQFLCGSLSTCLVAMSEIAYSIYPSYRAFNRLLSDSGLGQAPDLQAVLGVWRI
jgi:hypothetical protein